MRFQVASTLRSAALRSKCLELGEDLLDRIEVGTIGRQEEQLGASRADGLPDRLALVASEVVDDHDISWPQRRHRDLLDISQKALSIDRSVATTTRSRRSRE
jgi:hypothetical protein